MPSEAVEKYVPGDPPTALDLQEPLCFGEAMAEARQKSLDRLRTDTTKLPLDAKIWGAFQHYGQFEARLFPPMKRRPRSDGPAAQTRAGR